MNQAISQEQIQEMGRHWLPPDWENRSLHVHSDTTQFFDIGYGDVILLEGKPYLIRNSAREGRFGLDDEVKQRFDSLSVLVNNAGVWHRERTLTKDGYEETFAVNHLAHFLLTNDLEDLLVSAAPARVVNVSSSMHVRPKSLNWDDLMFEKDFRGFWAYGHSKLANVLFSNELARRWKDVGVTSNALNPGNVRSRITRNNVFLNFLHRSPLARLIIMSEEEGARTSLYVATSPDLEGVTGRYFDKVRESRASKAARDPEAAKRLWEVSDHLVYSALG